MAEVTVTTMGVKMMPWESRKVWKARICFIEDHLDKYEFDKALVMSMLWSNAAFMGCHYPAKTEALIRDYKLPDDHVMFSPKGDVYYIEMKHISRAALNGVEKTTVPQHEGRDSSPALRSELPEPPPQPISPAVKKESVYEDLSDSASNLEKYIAEARQKAADEKLRTKVESVEEFSHLLDGHWVKQYLTSNGSAHPVSLVHGICVRHELAVTFHVDSISSNVPSAALHHQSNLLINGGLVCNGTAQSTKKEAKKAVAEAVIDQLKSLASASQISPKVKVQTVDLSELQALAAGSNLPDYSKGSALLEKMGWKKNESLGRDPSADTHRTPIVPLLGKATRGLGWQSDIGVKVDEEAIRLTLKDFAYSDQDVMEFPTSLTTSERRIVHEHAQHFSLFHKSFGTEPNKYIMVRKKLEKSTSGKKEEQPLPSEQRHGKEESSTATNDPFPDHSMHDRRDAPRQGRGYSRSASRSGQHRDRPRPHSTQRYDPYARSSYRPRTK